MVNLKKPTEDMNYILATDVGSTTTKARFFRRIENREWRFVVAGEAPTTVEAPYEDVTLGVRNAVREVEELTGHLILSADGNGILVPFDGFKGVDLYCTTSSAGGGLQMMVSGLMKSITAESANRAALGAGAIVMDVIARDDGVQIHKKIQRIRGLRPDMILLAGGTDGGNVNYVLETAELIKAADPKPRLGATYRLPLIYAGNVNAQPEIQRLMRDTFALTIVENLRPAAEVENTEPARRVIHECFMEHVMSHAPGYSKLMNWVDIDILPTPAGEGMAAQLIAQNMEKNVLGVGLGGATTNVYSIVDGKFVRSVSANLGMSYSICNVLKEAGIDNIMRWIPFEIDKEKVNGMLANKMIRPTMIPQMLEELMIEHAVAREALRLGLEHHKTIATRLKGVRVQRNMIDIFDQALSETYIDMMKIDIIAGTGGLLSHAPRRAQSLQILTDAFQPEGVTWFFQDSVFMMPHLGVLSTVYPEAAWQIFDKDCLVRLGTVIAPRGLAKEGEDAMTVELEMPEGEMIEEDVKFGEIKRIILQEDKRVKVVVRPNRSFDIGLGPGHRMESIAIGGKVGIILDARGRPLILPESDDARRRLLGLWFETLDLYPERSQARLLSAKRSGSTVRRESKSAYAYAPGLKVKKSISVRKTRRLPILGEILVGVGDEVSYDSIVAKTFVSGDPYIVQVASALGVDTEELGLYMKKKVGDNVLKGEQIAGYKAFFGLMKNSVPSPVDGVIESVSEATGQVVIRGSSIPLQLTAYIPGKIVDVMNQEGVVIETNALFVQGIFGVGGERHGEIQFVVQSPNEVLTDSKISSRDAGCIIVGGSTATPEALRKAVQVGVSGVVVGGIEYPNLVSFMGREVGVAITGYEEAGVTLILTEGFGEMPMSYRTYNVLKEFEGKMAAVNGATQIRAGVIRPEIIVPHGEVAKETTTAEELAEGLVTGMPVRIIGNPYFGAIGKVHSLPVDLEETETESKVRVLEVLLNDGTIVTVPRANVEIIEE